MLPRSTKLCFPYSKPTARFTMQYSKQVLNKGSRTTGLLSSQMRQVLITPLRNLRYLRLRKKAYSFLNHQFSITSATKHSCQSKVDWGEAPSPAADSNTASSQTSFLFRSAFPGTWTPQVRKAPLPKTAPGTSSALTHTRLAQSHLGHELRVDLGHRGGHDFLWLRSRHGSTLPLLQG